MKGHATFQVLGPLLLRLLLRQPAFILPGRGSLEVSDDAPAECSAGPGSSWSPFSGTLAVPKSRTDAGAGTGPAGTWLNAEKFWRMVLFDS